MSDPLSSPTRDASLSSPAGAVARNSTLRSRRAIVATSLALLAVGGGGWYFWGEYTGVGLAAAAVPGGHSGGRERVTPIVVEAATSEDFPVRLSAIGTVVPRTIVTVRSRVDGVLDRILFDEGQSVRAGDLLAEIDPRSFEVALVQAQGQMGKDQALLANARADLSRYEGLARLDAIPVQQLDTQRALVRQYESAVKVDQGQVDNARLQLSYTHITAPADGRVGLRQVDPGNLVRVSDASGIVVITQIQPVTVVFPIPEAELGPVLARLGLQKPGETGRARGAGRRHARSDSPAAGEQGGGRKAERLASASAEGAVASARGHHRSAGDASGADRGEPAHHEHGRAEHGAPPGQAHAAGSRLIVEAWDRDGKLLLATGELLTVDNQIDISTGTVKVKAIFPNQDGALFPNQFVNVRLVVNELKEATVIPSAAVQRGAQGTFVWLLDEDKTVAMRPVGVSAADGERVAVLDGLKPGDQVAVDGFDRLREKARVEVVSQESRVVHAGPGKRGHHGGGHRRGDAGEPAAAASVRPQP